MNKVSRNEKPRKMIMKIYLDKLYIHPLLKYLIKILPRIV